MAKDNIDVLIIGSGHSGGMAAKVLTEKGISCVMLNAGPIAELSKDTERRQSAELPYRGFRPPDRIPHVFQANEFNANVWVDEKEVPYTTEPGQPYNWVRVRLFGGRSLFWSRQSLRLSDYEFKGKSHDGFGDDWPISHADLDPYYARSEAILRVRGGNDGVPQLPGGNYIVDSTPWTSSMQQVKAASEKKGMSFLVQRQSLGVDGLASSVNLLLPQAFQTGKLKAVPNVIVRELTVDRNTGLVDGANFVDRLTRREMSVKARRVVLAAGTLESTRLLLNSNIANSSGALGHYLADQFYGVGLNCSVPEARGRTDVTGIMGGGAVIPRFRNITKKSANFVRGYGFNVTSQPGPIAPRCFAAYGAELQRQLDLYQNSGLTIGVMGEVLCRYDNQVRISKDVVDVLGIPALHVQTRYTDNEFNQAREAVETAAELAETAGLEILARNSVPNPPGYSIHELGTCRMGNDPKTSVLNKWNQSHDIKNLFVVDGSSFVSAGWQNPTLTIMALAMRSSEYLAEQIRVGAV